jgi:hypothetical protein
MSKTLSRFGGLVACTLALTVAGFTPGTSALASSVGPTQVGPYQYFEGLVNGTLQNATVQVVCPGPVGTTGRALPGQTLAVTWLPVISVNSGFTGAKGRAIATNVGPPTSAAPTILFTSYNSPAAFPTDVPVPCGGTGVVVFSPLPQSKGARPATVTVSYVNVATTPGEASAG